MVWRARRVALAKGGCRGIIRQTSAKGSFLLRNGILRTWCTGIVSFECTMGARQTHVIPEKTTL